MSMFSFANLPYWAMCLSLALHLVAGMALGVLYFYGLWWNIRLYTSGRNTAMVLALGIGRMACVAGLLVLASLEGALPLLASALGMLIARFMVMRRVRGGSS